MNYFKSTTCYYIIPILKKDTGIDLIFEDGSKKITLHDYVNRNFSILKKLDKERENMYFNNPIWKYDCPDIMEEYDKCLKFIDDSIDFLRLPKHILAVGDDTVAIEPVTKTKITVNGYGDSLIRYRVSDRDLYKFYVDDYEEKTRMFFRPSNIALELSKKTKEDFKEEVEAYKTTNKGKRKGLIK